MNDEMKEDSDFDDVYPFYLCRWNGRFYVTPVYADVDRFFFGRMRIVVWAIYVFVV